MKQLIKSTIKYIQKLKDKTNDGIEEIVYYHLEETIKKYKINKKNINLNFHKILEMIKDLEGTSLVESLKIIDAVLKTNHLPGDICEFGVAQGKMSKILAYLILNNNKKFYIYDSFQGLPAGTGVNIQGGAALAHAGETIVRTESINMDDTNTILIEGFDRMRKEYRNTQNG